MTDSLALEKDKAALSRLADIAERMAQDRWGMVADGDNMRVTSFRGEGEEVTICILTSAALPDEIDLIAGALDDLRLFARSRARASEAFRALREQVAGGGAPRLREGDFAANAAMLCGERTFQRFLEETGADGAVRDKDAADKRLKALLGITSKRQLNDDLAAQAGWIDLRSRYQAWMRG